MAGISILAPLDYRGRLFNFSRDGFQTIADMAGYNEDYLPDFFEAYCVEDGNKYRYRRTNDVDPITGRWRVIIEGGISELPTASASVKGAVKIGDGLTVTGEVLSADEQTEENFTTELKEKLEGIDMDTKVDVEDGKGLSTNDLTDELKAKYDKAEENVQSDWDETDETVDSFIKGKPTKLSDFDNDEEFITKAVDDLENYYKSSETYTQSEVNALVNAINSFELKKVDILPTEGINPHCIYFVPHGDTEGNLFDEFIYIDEKWENLGPAVIDKTANASDVVYENESHSDWDNVQKALDNVIERVDPITDVIPEAATSQNKLVDTNSLRDLLTSKVPVTRKVNGHALSEDIEITKSDVGLGNVGDFKAVSTVASQGLTSTEKSNARTNIGAGTYSKPSAGIPSTDLTTAVQTSLGKADTALQEHQDISGKLNNDGSNISGVKEFGYNTLKDTPEVTSSVTKDAQILFKHVTPSKTNGSYYYRKIGLLWDYIKGQIDSVYSNPARRCYGKVNSNSSYKYITINFKDTYAGILCTTGYNGNIWFESAGGIPYKLDNVTYGFMGYAWSEDNTTLYLKCGGYRNITITIPSLNYGSSDVTFNDWEGTPPAGVTFKTNYNRLIRESDVLTAIDTTSNAPISSTAVVKGCSETLASGYSIYDATKTYALGDIVSYSNVLYYCSTAITKAEAWTSSKWTSLGNLKSWITETAVHYITGTYNSTTYPNYNETKTYAVGDYAVYSDILYKCSTAITKAEAWTSEHWTTSSVTLPLTGTDRTIKSLKAGLTIAFKLPLKGSGAVTIDINSLGAKALRYNDSAYTTHLAKNTVVLLTYDGTYWRWANYDANSDTKVTQSSSTTSGDFPVLSKYDANTTAVTNAVKYNSKILMNHSTGNFKATSFTEDGTALSSKYLGKTASAAKAYSNAMCTCSTAADKNAKVVTSGGSISLIRGRTILMYNTYTNTAKGALTLNVDETGAKTLIVNGSNTTNTSTTTTMASGYYTCVYDGTNWRAESSYEAARARTSASSNKLNFANSNYTGNCDSLSTGTLASVDRTATNIPSLNAVTYDIFTSAAKDNSSYQRQLAISENGIFFRHEKSSGSWNEWGTVDNNFLYGKKVNFVGDSITKGTNGDGTSDYVDIPFPEYIAKKYGCTVNNYGIGASTVCDYQGTTGFPTNPMVTRIKNIDKTADITVIFGGTNDFSYQATLGQHGDADTTKFCGAWFSIIDWIKTNCPSMKIVICSPIRRANSNANSNVTYPLKVYADVVESCAKEWGVNFINLYDGCPFDLSKAKQDTQFGGDGLHPNQEGYKVLGDYIGSKLATLSFDIPQGKWFTILYNDSISAGTTTLPVYYGRRWTDYSKIQCSLRFINVLFSTVCIHDDALYHKEYLTSPTASGTLQLEATLEFNRTKTSEIVCTKNSSTSRNLYIIAYR